MEDMTYDIAGSICCWFNEKFSFKKAKVNAIGVMDL